MTKYLLIVVVLLSAVSVSAQHPVFTIGPKIGYTFGEEGSIILGLEASYFPFVKDPATDLFRFGTTFDITFWEDHTSFHLGAEVIGAWYLGIDIGPTLVIDETGSSLGLGVIAFVGAIIYPYYELIELPNRDYHSAGVYIKLPPGVWVGDDGWWAMH